MPGAPVDTNTLVLIANTCDNSLPGDLDAFVYDRSQHRSRDTGIVILAPGSAWAVPRRKLSQMTLIIKAITAQAFVRANSIVARGIFFLPPVQRVLVREAMTPQSIVHMCMSPVGLTCVPDDDSLKKLGVALAYMCTADDYTHTEYQRQRDDIARVLLVVLADHLLTTFTGNTQTALQEQCTKLKIPVKFDDIFCTVPFEAGMAPVYTRSNNKFFPSHHDQCGTQHGSMCFVLHGGNVRLCDGLTARLLRSLLVRQMLQYIDASFNTALVLRRVDELGTRKQNVPFVRSDRSTWPESMRVQRPVSMSKEACFAAVQLADVIRGNCIVDSMRQLLRQPVLALSGQQLSGAVFTTTTTHPTLPLCLFQLTQREVVDRHKHFNNSARLKIAGFIGRVLDPESGDYAIRYELPEFYKANNVVIPNHHVQEMLNSMKSLRKSDPHPCSSYGKLCAFRDIEDAHERTRMCCNSMHRDAVVETTFCASPEAIALRVRRT